MEFKIRHISLAYHIHVLEESLVSLVRIIYSEVQIHVIRRIDCVLGPARVSPTPIPTVFMRLSGQVLIRFEQILDCGRVLGRSFPDPQHMPVAVFIHSHGPNHAPLPGVHAIDVDD